MTAQDDLVEMLLHAIADGATPQSEPRTHTFTPGPVSVEQLAEAWADLSDGRALRELRGELPQGWGFDLSVDNEGMGSIIFWGPDGDQIGPPRVWYPTIAEAAGAARKALTK